MAYDILEKLELIDEIPHVNHGGCAIVAYSTYEFIKRKHPELEAQIVYLFCNSYYDNEMLELMAQGKPASCSHAMVKIGDDYYDSEGSYTRYELEKEHGVTEFIDVTPEYVLKCINNARWNSMFNRKKSIPRIAKVLELETLCDIIHL